MLELENKQILVIGLGSRGLAACEFLHRSGARVVGVDHADSHVLRRDADRLRPLGIEVALGVSAPPERKFSLAILSSALPANTPLVEAVRRSHVPLISELELGLQRSQCLNIAVAGTEGKGTTAELIERVLRHSHRRTILSGHRGRPVCSVIEETRNLDYLILQVDVFQLEMSENLRPSIAVVMSVAPDYLDRSRSTEARVRANARVFRNQQALDWAIVQGEALAQVRELNLPVPAKVITFSAEDRNADLYLDDGLLVSRIPNWSGPLLDQQNCQLRGPHNAENLMAVLAVSHVLRLPLAAVTAPLKTYLGGADRFELVAEIKGVQYINDSKTTNVEALRKSICATRLTAGGEPNLWLIAGGKDKGLEFRELGPLLSKRIKRAFLVGEAGTRLGAAWAGFTPCTVTSSLLEAVTEAAENATSGDVVLLAPACSSWDQFRNHQHRREVFRQAVNSIARGVHEGTPNMHGNVVTTP